MRGVVVLDNSCYKALAPEAARQKLQRDFRTACWEVWPSAINALEASQAPDAIRRRLRATIRALEGGRGLLPWLVVLLERTARTIAAGRAGFWSGPSRLDWLLDDDASVDPQAVQRAKNFLVGQISGFETMHQGARPRIQKLLRAGDLRDEWETLPRFLDSFWMTPGHIDQYLRHLWTHFGLPEPAPLAALRGAETWRLFFEAHGAAVFEREVAKKMPKRVQLPDLLQLVYMAGARRRMIVSADHGLLRIAHAVLRARYANAWAVHISSLEVDDPAGPPAAPTSDNNA